MLVVIIVRVSILSVFTVFIFTLSPISHFTPHRDEDGTFWRVRFHPHPLCSMGAREKFVLLLYFCHGGIGCT